jgi:hypothetical protein
MQLLTILFKLTKFLLLISKCLTFNNMDTGGGFHRGFRWEIRVAKWADFRPILADFCPIKFSGLCVWPIFSLPMIRKSNEFIDFLRFELFLST